MNNLEKRIFDSQPDLFALDTAIESCEKSKDGWAVTLDKTIFFPRGGGQPCDKGSINGLEVKDTYEENGKIKFKKIKKAQTLPSYSPNNGMNAFFNF